MMQKSRCQVMMACTSVLDVTSSSVLFHQKTKKTQMIGLQNIWKTAGKTTGIRNSVECQAEYTLTNYISASCQHQVKIYPNKPKRHSSWKALVQGPAFRISDS